MAEYGLIAALVSVLSIGALSNLGNGLNGTFFSLAGAMEGYDGPTYDEYMQFFVDYDTDFSFFMSAGEIDAMMAVECPSGNCRTGAEIVAIADGEMGGTVDGQLGLLEWEWYYDYDE